MTKWVLDLPFEQRLLAQALGARWDKNIKEMVYEGQSIPHGLDFFVAPIFSVGWHKQYHLNGKHINPPMKQEPAFVSRPHQQLATTLMGEAYKQQSPGFLLADEVGVGKTMSAWGFALTQPSLQTILIVTTSAAQAHWRNTILHAGWLAQHRVIIINYDRLGKLFVEPDEGLSSTRRKGKRKRLAKQGEAPSFDLIIFDESHKGKNPQRARGLMMRKLGQRARFCIWASATAGQHPVELVYLHQLLAYSTNTRVPGGDIEDFVQWCVKQGLRVQKGRYGKIEWTPNDEDIALVHSWLFKAKPVVALRRRPEDVQGWHALRRELMPVTLDANARAHMGTAWDEFVRNYKTEKSKTSHTTIETSLVRLRQQSSLIRVPSTTQLCLDILEQRTKPCVSVAFRQTQTDLVERLQKEGVRVAFIHGSQNAMEKERQRLNFQQGRADVIVFTVEEAISLHQGEHEDVPRILLVHDVRWSAIQMSQIEGRAHRDGQLAPAWWLAAEQTVDMDLAATMIERVRGMKSMHGDDVADLRAMQEVLDRLVHQTKK